MRPAAARSAFTAEFDLDATQTEAVDLLTRPDEHGVYLWGPVGRGKTWLLDRYFGGVATGAKRRVHFHCSPIRCFTTRSSQRSAY
ncbi:MAG: AFG1/ZapE family ATPase [Rhodococcus sp. (in: high G+C Gram-positive bacteria)]